MILKCVLRMLPGLRTVKFSINVEKLTWGGLLLLSQLVLTFDSPSPLGGGLSKHLRDYGCLLPAMFFQVLLLPIVSDGFNELRLPLVSDVLKKRLRTSVIVNV